MENAVEALKIAFAVMMFIMALSLSIFSLSQANNAVTAITSLNDRETEYSYVEPSSNTRIVGVETIVPTMYKAYKENFKIYFVKKDGTPLAIYYATDDFGNRKTDEHGNPMEISYIDGSEVFANAQEAVEHLDYILWGNPNNIPDDRNKKYKNQRYHSNGLYDFLSGKQFKEELGEYYENDSEDTPEVNKAKTRVITYTLQ